MITVKSTRAEVSQNFIEEAKHCMELVKEKIESEISFTLPSIQERVKKDRQPAIDRINKLLSSEKAMDFEITKLRGMKYSKFLVQKCGDVKYLAGIHNNVILEDERIMYSLGEYLIAVPISVFLSGDVTAFHFVPLRSPNSINRFPHHMVKPYQNPERVTGDKFTGNPLSVIPSTCWGSFGSVIPMFMADGDIAELFRILSTYITRYNPSSPLTYFRNIEFKKELK